MQELTKQKARVQYFKIYKDYFKDERVPIYPKKEFVFRVLAILIAGILFLFPQGKVSAKIKFTSLLSNLNFWASIALLIVGFAINWSILCMAAGFCALVAFGVGMYASNACIQERSIFFAINTNGTAQNQGLHTKYLDKIEVIKHPDDYEQVEAPKCAERTITNIKPSEMLGK